MSFRYSNKGILLRRWIARWFFFPVYISQYCNIFIKLFFYNKNQPLVIILTPGKVCSSSVYFNLKKQVTSRIFHIHYFSENGIKTSRQEHKNSSRKSLPFHLITSIILSRLIKKYKNKFYVITIFREPIQRKISSFFQNLDKYKQEINLNGLSFNSNKINLILNDKYFLTNSNEEDLWIKNELINTFGFLVYKKNEIKNNNYILEKTPNVDLLILKMENLNKNFSFAVSNFLNLEKPINFKKYNSGEEKYYKNEYKKFNDNFKLKTQTLKILTETKYFNTFYCDVKLKIFESWKN